VGKENFNALAEGRHRLNSSGIQARVRDLAWGSSEEIAAFEATLYIKSCSRSAGVCERAVQHSRSICCGCEKDENWIVRHLQCTTKSVFVLFATRETRYPVQWLGEKILRRSVHRVELNFRVLSTHVIFVPW